ncbi:probable insulin-like peptide 5 [Drosophila montana]|uniref:probable insulin-like peptide 5 n=1 Tax=Drosophila montana TaxID=40370 RepID=UPI00313D2FD1
MAKTKQTQLQPMFLLPLLLLLLMGFCSANSIPSYQVCGSKLTDALYMVCKGNFGSFQHHKRGSLDLFDYVEQQYETNDVEDRDTLWGLPPRNSLTATRRLMRGVVDECCRKPCTRQEMLQYCGN